MGEWEWVALVEPVHTLGWPQAQVKQYLAGVLTSFSGHAGVAIAQFEAQVELHPETCPIVECPMR